MARLDREESAADILVALDDLLDPFSKLDRLERVMASLEKVRPCKVA